jgi:hypothetical protein
LHKYCCRACQEKDIDHKFLCGRKPLSELARHPDACDWKSLQIIRSFLIGDIASPDGVWCVGCFMYGVNLTWWDDWDRPAIPAQRFVELGFFCNNLNCTVLEVMMSKFEESTGTPHPKALSSFNDVLLLQLETDPDTVFRSRFARRFYKSPEWKPAVRAVVDFLIRVADVVSLVVQVRPLASIVMGYYEDFEHPGKLVSHFSNFSNNISKTFLNTF